MKLPSAAELSSSLASAPVRGPSIDSSMLVPLVVMTIAFTLLFFTLYLAAMRNEILRRRVRTMRMIQAQELAEARP